MNTCTGYSTLYRRSYRNWTVYRLASLGLLLALLLGLAHPMPAQMPPASLPSAPVGMASERVSERVSKTGESRRIEQPCWAKVAVTAGSLGLIGLELWWFLGSRPKPRQVSVVSDE